MAYQKEQTVLRVPGFVPVRDGTGLGDVVKKVTNRLGIPTCLPCEERRKRWNQVVIKKGW